MTSHDEFCNKRLLLIHRPKGMPRPEDFRLDVKPLSKTPPIGGVIFQTLYVSIDPAMRGWMSAAASYLPPVKLGYVMRASSIGRILVSDSPTKFPVGSIVCCEDGGVQTYVAVRSKNLRFLSILDVSVLTSNLPVSSFLGVLGTTGLTAYFGLLRIGMPQSGDTVLVSGAAGATGSVVCQIAKIKGCKVIGTAGSEDKCRWLQENGIVDVAIDYKTKSGKLLSRAIRKACPDGANVVFDNVGGEFLEAALGNIARGARIVLCGAISQYNIDGSSGSLKGPRNYMNLLVKRASMKGFVVFDYRKEYNVAIRNLSQWIENGELKHKEDRVDGIDNFYLALMSLFTGKNKGKMVLRMKEDATNTQILLRSKF
mmetsp:Transcript_24891/g.37604  ORF Transcript_24891/g.37604 Transcript_24891/m.37604 type:complete len:369 (+) Transcript_24891:169-1275(+)|eukprot:CAMPEP_0194207600 /NCGR_PEP_ID=MMETSP0156-20130528/6293_1 /TAXON_ID=33649 /ORGANISM="Thalassionema nitzschioides, Strain L26-B" /LENGTH=368 /DNA_ID=CAMNT_0038934397 /DNA_START=143 /DNA_END=1249 /DNA_ORIENTATION=-